MIGCMRLQNYKYKNTLEQVKHLISSGIVILCEHINKNLTPRCREVQTGLNILFKHPVIGKFNNLIVSDHTFFKYGTFNIDKEK